MNHRCKTLQKKLVIPGNVLTYIIKMLHQHEDADNGYDNVATTASAHAQLDKQMNRCMGEEQNR